MAEQWLFKITEQAVRDNPTMFGDRYRQYGDHHRKSTKTLQWK